MTAGTRPVLVLTRGPRLILELTVFIGHDQAAFEQLLNLLVDFDTAVNTDFEEDLPEDCISVFAWFLRLPLRLGLENTAV